MPSTYINDATIHFIKRWWSLIVLVVFFTSSIGGYFAGYRLTSGPTIKRLVTLTVSDLPKGASMYIDNKRQPASEASVRFFKVLPGNHVLVGNADGFLPWYTLATLPKTDSLVRAFFIPATVPVSILTGDDANHVKKILASYTLPDKNNPLILADNCVAVYVSYNQIIAKPVTSSSCVPPPFLCFENACDPTILFSTSESITSVLAYPYRDDSLLVAVGRNVYALTLDPREPRVIAPVLQSRTPMIVKNEDGDIVGMDGPTIFKLSFPTHPEQDR